MRRPGLDVDVMLAIQQVDALIKDMRANVTIPEPTKDEDTAVKHYLLYASMLVDSILPDIIMSAIAGHDVMVQMKQRPLLEFSAKAMYFHQHPDYALFAMTIGEAMSILKKNKLAESPPDVIAQAQLHLDKMKERFSAVAHFKKELGFDDIMEPYAKPADYVWLDKAPSALLHGDPEGIRVFAEVQPDGTLLPTLTYPLAHINAMLVDAGRNGIVLCDSFIERFHPKNAEYRSRVSTLYRKFLNFLLKHTYGRGDVASSIRQRLAELDAEEAGVAEP